MEIEITKKPLEERTDRELVISQILLQRQQIKKTTSILNYIAFIFWAGLFVSFIYGLILFSAE